MLTMIIHIYMSTMIINGCDSIARKIYGFSLCSCFMEWVAIFLYLQEHYVTPLVVQVLMNLCIQVCCLLILILHDSVANML